MLLASLNNGSIIAQRSVAALMAYRCANGIGDMRASAVSDGTKLM